MLSIMCTKLKQNQLFSERRAATQVLWKMKKTCQKMCESSAKLHMLSIMKCVKRMQICTCCQSCAQNLSKIKCFWTTCRKPKCCEKCENMSENVWNECKSAHVVDHVHKAHVKWYVSENVEDHGKMCDNQCKIAHVVRECATIYVKLHMLSITCTKPK